MIRASFPFCETASAQQRRFGAFRHECGGKRAQHTLEITDANG